MSDFPPDSVAFITGAASGIGFAVAQRLIADGVKNIALIDLSAELLEKASPSLHPQSNTILLCIAADCSVEAEVENAVEKTVEKFGRLDFCFNAAGRGVGPNGPGKIEALGSEDFDKVVGLNLRGVWLCERAQIRQMMRQEVRDVSTGLPLQTRGSIVNVGSLTSHLAINNIGPYIMSKHGVLGLSRSDAVDYAKEGIRVNCLAPGWIKTNMTQMLWESPAGAVMAARAPINRWGLPEEVAYTVSFLLSDKASFITGTDFHVDGGYSAC